ncbi:hypothetical protein SAMN05216252_12013 [Actinacidiphila glaucinigra]|uniref:Uncharacterized protein n=1 Tax=Actinacidiphila glaucinigra TaxID=235986 RepID=A0A239LJH8_9ACTN|nr:hypothetical protein SAMN05216252_12013 [Actinacidiphila glaucinigra]
MALAQGPYVEPVCPIRDVEGGTGWLMEIAAGKYPGTPQ